MQLSSAAFYCQHGVKKPTLTRTINLRRASPYTSTITDRERRPQERSCRKFPSLSCHRQHSKVSGHDDVAIEPQFDGQVNNNCYSIMKMANVSHHVQTTSFAEFTSTMCGLSGPAWQFTIWVLPFGLRLTCVTQASTMPGRSCWKIDHTISLLGVTSKTQ